MANYYRTWADGEVVTASNVQNYLQDGVVVQCDSSADYPTGREGMVVYDKALDAYLGYTGAAWVRIVPLTSTAVQTWTPTVTQSGSVAVTASEARYIRTGAVVEAWCHVTVNTGATGSSGSSVTVSLPVTAAGHTAGTPIGVGTITDGTGAQYSVTVQYATATTVAFIADDASGTGGFGIKPAVGLAQTDTIRFHIRYTV